MGELSDVFLVSQLVIVGITALERLNCTLIIGCQLKSGLRTSVKLDANNLVSFLVVWYVDELVTQDLQRLTPEGEVLLLAQVLDDLHFFYQRLLPNDGLPRLQVKVQIVGELTEVVREALEDAESHGLILNRLVWKIDLLASSDPLGLLG